LLLRRDPLANPEPLVRRVYAYVAYRMGDGPEAEDVTSDVFEHAVRYRSSYDWQKGEPTAWLIGIARRCIAQAYAARQPGHSEPADWPMGGDFEAEAIERLALRGAVARLDDRERELVALRYGSDLRARQIAEVLGMRTNSVEVALHRTLARLRSILNEEERGLAPSLLDPAEKPA
jgi:RNA polymerase sigma-70 factor, ECF subfamily